MPTKCASHRWINDSVITEVKYVCIRTSHINANVAVNEEHRLNIKEPYFFTFKFMNIVEWQ